jgi:amidase
LLLQAAAELSIIRRSKTERECALAKSEWSSKSAVECSAALAAKKISAVELAQDAIARIERHDAKINAVCVRDFPRGLDAARAADAALARGETRPLLDLPMKLAEPIEREFGGFVPPPAFDD